MRNRFDKELEILHTDLIEMGSLIETSIGWAVSALTKKDDELARKAIEFDSEIDQKERDIERRCLKLLLHEQPVATDLRLISTALKMITDMERIGDQAADISEISLRISKDEKLIQFVHIPKMAEAAVRMVKKSIDAFVKMDIEMAQEVIASDDVIDRLFDCVKNDLITYMVQNIQYGEQAIDLLMIAKYFERIGDHATNIAEWVVFSITGVHKNQKIV